MKFYIGTTNPNKIREIGSILSATGCEFECTHPVDPEETEADFEGNALLKARVYAAYVGGTTISEDSGLIIPSLNNLPGPWSARFSDYKVKNENGELILHDYKPSGLSRLEIDNLNNKLVLELMQGVEQPRRAAMFKVVLAVSTLEGKILFKASGESHGWISEEARGSNGFGYDPIFVGQDTFGKTYAELDSHRKNLRSHRRHVLQEFKAWLGNYLKNEGAE